MGTPRALIALTVLVSIGCGSRGSDDIAATRPSSGTVVVDGAELSWVREGNGPPVFVLGSAVYYPKAFSQELRRHFELVFVDGRHLVPDYAPGREALREVDLSTFADDVEVVRQALGYDRVSVIGHSIHGQIAVPAGPTSDVRATLDLGSVGNGTTVRPSRRCRLRARADLSRCRHGHQLA